MHKSTKALLLSMIMYCTSTQTMFFPPITDAQWKLSKAIQENDLVSVKSLIAAGTEISQNGFGSPALHQAVVFEHETIVALLLEKGADPNCVNYHGETALCKAARMGNLKLAQMLKAAGANVNAVSDSHQTPLSCAIHGLPKLPWNKQRAMIIWLLREKALISEEKSARPLACTNHKEVQQLLRKIGITTITVCE